MKKTGRVALFLICVAMLLTTPATTAVSAEEFNTISLRIGHTEAIDSIREDACQFFVNRISELTGGNVTVTSFAASQLGSIPAMVEQLQTGGLDFTLATPGILESYDPDGKTGIAQMPYLFETYEQAWAFMDGDYNTKLYDPLIGRNVRLVAMWENGFRHTTNSSRPIEKPEDLRGLKIRVPQNRAIETVMNSLGANPVPMAIAEVYTALQSKVLDGQENPYSVVIGNRFVEVQQYMSLTSHMYEPIVMIVSEHTWNRLNESTREAVVTAGKDAGAFIRQAVVDMEAQWKADLEAEGMLINAPDLTPFMEVVEGAYAQFHETYGEGAVIECLAEAAKIREQFPAP